MEIQFFPSEKALCNALKKRGREIVVITDTTVADLYAHRLCQRLGTHCFSFVGGEQNKTRKTKEELENALMEQRVSHNALVVGMGGGVVTDLAGFVAATYLRGVRFLIIPTTLMAAVDAAIGGKNGVNTPYGKNLIGTFYAPEALFLHLPYLETLPQQEVLSGMAEVIKYGCILDASLFDQIQPGIPLTQALITHCIALKRSVVEKDPRGTGLRRILNFGHTIGHAMEHATGYKISHGHAVALGLWVEACLSADLGFLSHKAVQKIHAKLQAFGFDLHIPFDKEAFSKALKRDKKGELFFVLIKAIGHVIDDVGRTVPEESVEALYGRL